MVTQELVNWMFGILGVICGAIIKVMWDGIQGLQQSDQKLAEKVASIEILVAGNYATREHVENIFRELSTALFKKLDKIEDKLDGKVDKP